MTTFDNTVMIRRNAADVFAYLADFQNVPAWNYAIAQTRKVTPGAVGVGTAYRQTRSMPTTSTESFTVTEYQPETRLGIAGDLGPFQAHISYQLEPTSDGTKLTNTITLSSSPILRLATPLFTPRIKKSVVGNLDKLKSILEATDEQ